MERRCAAVALRRETAASSSARATKNFSSVPAPAPAMYTLERERPTPADVFDNKTREPPKQRECWRNSSRGCCKTRRVTPAPPPRSEMPYRKPGMMSNPRITKSPVRLSIRSR
jgi:hypothetical protein